MWWKKFKFRSWNFEKFIKSIRKNEMMSRLFFIWMKWCRDVLSFEWNDVGTYFHFIRMKWEYFRTTFISVEVKVFNVTPNLTRSIPRRSSANIVAWNNVFNVNNTITLTSYAKTRNNAMFAQWIIEQTTAECQLIDENASYAKIRILRDCSIVWLKKN